MTKINIDYQEIKKSYIGATKAQSFTKFKVDFVKQNTYMMTHCQIIKLSHFQIGILAYLPIVIVKLSNCHIIKLAN